MSTLSVRRPLSVVAVVAMVATMLFAVAGTASAAAPSPPSSACPATIPDAGFTDIGGFNQETQDSINCIAFYDVTQGTSATTYAPNDDVNRWQMALFLTRKFAAAGETLPSGTVQGFLDIGTLPAATQTAINQLAQLNITLGTSATTFEPMGIVNRWQMALFITRQLTAAGVALPSGAPQGFTDIGTLPGATQTAINQLAQLNITLGTSATTYDPMADVNRWQMALFLARDLDVMGVAPTGLVRVVVTPADSVDLADGFARTYTATFTNADGTPYVGWVGIELLDATAAGAPIYNSDPTDVLFQSVDGIVNVTVEFNGFAGTDGIVNFIVRNGVGTAATDVVPVAWIDLDTDNGYEATGDNAPTEPFALGGVTNFAADPAAEADDLGVLVGLVVDSVDAAGDSFEAAEAAVDCGPGAVGDPCTFEYDGNDTFEIGGLPVSMPVFEAALSVTDVLTIDYDPDVPLVSIFNITTDNTVGVGFTVTTPAADVDFEGDSFTIEGTGIPGNVVAIYDDIGDTGVRNVGDPKLAEGTVAGDGTWSLTVLLDQDAGNDFVATQRATAGTDDLGTGVDVPTITEGPPVAAVITGIVGANVGVVGILDVTDTIVITFDESVAGVGDGDSITIIDADGSTATLVFGTDVTAVLSTVVVTDDTLTLTIDLLVFTTGGAAGIQPDAQIQSISGFEGADGLAIDIIGSGGNRVFDGF